MAERMKPRPLSYQRNTLFKEWLAIFAKDKGTKITNAQLRQIWDLKIRAPTQDYYNNLRIFQSNGILIKDIQEAGLWLINIEAKPDGT